MKRNRVSVVILTFNEEKNLPDCLEAVNWADEIVIVDSSSSDKTTEIAKKFKCKVFQKEFKGFGELKNFAISKTANNWILNLDADERVTNELRKEIESELENPEFNGYYFPRKSYVGKKWLRYAGQYPSYQLRLFRKDMGKFEDSVIHERAKVKGKTGYMKNDLLHYNFRSWKEFVDKMNWLTTIEARELIKKKFVSFYPMKKIREFFGEYSRLRKGENDRRTSYVLARNVLSDYEIGWLLPLRFITTFTRLYFLQQGFRDGFYGFMWASLVSMHMSVRHYKYHELKHDMVLA